MLQVLRVMVAMHEEVMTIQVELSREDQRALGARELSLSNHLLYFLVDLLGN